MIFATNTACCQHDRLLQVPARSSSPLAGWKSLFSSAGAVIAVPERRATRIPLFERGAARRAVECRDIQRGRNASPALPKSYHGCYFKAEESRESQRLEKPDQTGFSVSAPRPGCPFHRGFHHRRIRSPHLADTGEMARRVVQCVSTFYSGYSGRSSWFGSPPSGLSRDSAMASAYYLRTFHDRSVVPE